MKRTHDNFYLKEDNLNIKQSFIEVADVISTEEFHSIADIGCATGAFPGYLKTRFPDAEIQGIEYLESLISKARSDFPEVTFKQGDVLNNDSVNEKYDVITMLGVLCIFDDYKVVLENALSWLNPNGRLILHNMISDFDIDVFVKYKSPSLSFEPSELESGWNIISHKTLSLIAEANNARIISSKNFNLEVKLDKQDDVMRSWTEENMSGGNDIFNALHIRQPQKIVTIKKV